LNAVVRSQRPLVLLIFQPVRFLILPTGFANKQYTKTGIGLGRSKPSLEKFVTKGGTLLVFSPLVPEYEYEWLPFSLKYVMEEHSCTPQPVGKHDAQKLIKNIDPPVGCDGYFAETDADVALKDDRGQAYNGCKRNWRRHDRCNHNS